MSRQTIIELPIVIAVGAALMVPGLWNRDVWHPLEPQYAQTAHEIVSSGDWLDLKLNGEPYYNKPPLFFWFEAICIEAFGRNTAAVRVPSLLFGIGSLVVCYLIARRVGVQPLLPALVLATSYDYWFSAQRTTLDITLCFFVMLAFLLYLESRESKVQSPESDAEFEAQSAGRSVQGSSFIVHRSSFISHRSSFIIGLALSVGAAMLIKGPVSLMSLAFAIVPWLVWRRKWRELLNWRLLVPIAGGVVIFLAWMAAAFYQQGPDFIKTMVGREFVSRIEEGVDKRPVYHYLLSLGNFLPWIVFLPGAIRHAWKRRAEPLFQILLWFAAGLVVFSLIPTKANRYILGLYPPMAILVGAYLASWVRDPARGSAAVRWLSVGTLAVCAIGGAAMVAGNQAGARWGQYGLHLGLPALGAGIIGLLLWRRLGVKALVGVAACLGIAASVIYFPLRNAEKSPRPLATFLNGAHAAPENVVWYRSYEPGVAYYAGFPVMPCVNELASLSEHPGKLIIAAKRDAAARPDVFGDVKPVSSFRLGREEYEVYGEAPAEVEMPTRH